MKPIWMAILNARRLKFLCQWMKNTGTVLLMSFLLLIISCDKSDELEAIANDSSIEEESPQDKEPPKDNQSPPVNESPTDESNIIYTDIEPDLNGKNIKDSYNLDLNNDNIIDFTLSSFNDSLVDWLLISTNPNNKNGIMSVAPWYTHPVPLDSGQEIFNLRGYRDGEFYETWSVFNVGRCFAGEPECSYDWENKVDKYVGLRFFVKGETHYGWARIEVSSPSQWVIKDYAYNATPNKPILAGQK